MSSLLNVKRKASKTIVEPLKSPTEIASIRHKKDTRVNIPTEELRDFVTEDEKARRRCCTRAIRRSIRYVIDIACGPLAGRLEWV